MTAGKRAPTRKQTSADFSRHSQNYAFSVKTRSRKKRKARTRRGWTWTGCLSCHTTLKRQGCSSVIRAKFCSDGCAACGNKNSTSSHPWQRTHSQLCHAADCPILVQSERIFLCPCERESLKSKSVLPLCRHHMCKGEFSLGGAETRVMSSLWSSNPCMHFTSLLQCDNPLSLPGLHLLHLLMQILFFPSSRPLCLPNPPPIPLHPALSGSPSSSIYFWVLISTTCKPSN